MAGVTVKIEPDIINWILQKLQLENVNSSIFDILNKWKSGEKEPTFNQIETISKKANIPLGYFFLQTPPKEDCKIVEYRTIDSVDLQNPSRNLLDTVDIMINRQEWMREYLIANGYDKREFVGKFKNSDNHIGITNNMREVLNLDINWYDKSSSPIDSYKILRKRFEEVGILVMMNGVVGQNNRRLLGIKEFRAFTLVDEYAPLIFINTQDSDAGKLFSLLHEAAHIWLGVNSFYNDQYGFTIKVNTLERLCNAIVAEILVPSNVFLGLWNKKNNKYSEQIEEIAKFFKCSRSVIARKALAFKFITNIQYANIIDESIKQYDLRLKQKKDEKSGGGNYYNTMGSRIDHRFLIAVSNSAKEGKTQYTEAYHLTNTNRSTFAKLVSNVGGTL